MQGFKDDVVGLNQCNRYEVHRQYVRDHKLSTASLLTGSFDKSMIEMIVASLRELLHS